ncbi:2OG-Fe(II) oxygenase family protein [Pseudomonas asiatica]|uniref:2OG-Fe(II) oxygenase family protein n=1 Tax=Pseudomonas asiatica TaxID=2219225 RepID=UPI00383BEF84
MKRTDFESPTQRPLVTLPPMPLESQLKHYPPITMARSHFAEGRLIFESNRGLDQALRQGFFLVKPPAKIDFSSGDLFVRNFFLPQEKGDLSNYTGFKQREIPGAYEGYFNRAHDQWENLYVAKDNWQLIPEKVALLGRQMADLGIMVLRAILTELSIPHEEWARVTGGLSEGTGHQMLGFNHFRSDKPSRGSKFHRDSGWITVLRSTEPGLIAYIDDALHSINPEPGYLIVNFGSAMEVFTEQMKNKVRASIHGVVRTERASLMERYSYVVFLDNDLAGDIYQYTPKGIKSIQSVIEFAEQEVNRTYNSENLL